MHPTEAPVIAELHVDDLAIEAGASQRDAERLVAAIAEAAQGAGARLSFRFRRRFAEAAARGGASNPLRALEAAGHEVGTHAHGRGLRRAHAAVSACGVANRGATPGMVQAGDRVGGLWREIFELGFDWITDHPPQRRWAYAGVLAWRPGPSFTPGEPPLGPVMLETSADPFAWGLLQRDGAGVAHQHHLSATHFELLEALYAAHARPLPAGAAPYFSFALHEHNLCARGSLQPRPQALDALEAFLRRHRVVTAGEQAATVASAELLRAPPEPRGVRLARRVRMASRPVRQRLGRRGPSQAGPFEVAAGQRRLHAMWLGPAEPRGLLLVSHAGVQGGVTTGLRPFGIDPIQLTAQGLALVCYDRSGTGRSTAPTALTPGNRVHVQDFREVLRAVRGRLGQGAPLGVLSFSSGILPPLRAGEPFAFLLDGEAPADRWSLLPPAGAHAPTDPALAALPLHQDDAWQGREPAALLAGLACPYHRFQAELDHVHGRLDVHARLMIQAAHAAGLPSVRANGGDELRLLPGRLHAHGKRIERWIAEAFEEAEGRA